MDAATPFSYLPHPAPPLLPPSPRYRVYSLVSPSSGITQGCSSNSKSGFGHTALNPCFGLNPPKKQQKGGGRELGVQAGCRQPLPALLGAAGTTSTGSTAPLQLWKVKTKPWRCSSPSPTPTQAMLQLFREKGWEIKGYQAPGLSYQKLPVAFGSGGSLLGGSKLPAVAIPLARLMCNPGPAVSPLLPVLHQIQSSRTPGATPEPDLPNPKRPELFRARFSRATTGDSQQITSSIALHPGHHLRAPLTQVGRRIPIAGRRIPSPGRFFPASPAAGEAEGSASRAGISWAARHGYLRPVLWVRAEQARRDLRGRPLFP